MISTIFEAPDTFTDGRKYQILVWWNYLQAQKDVSYTTRCELYERSVLCLPYSYKLWMNYLKEVTTSL